MNFYILTRWLVVFFIFFSIFFFEIFAQKNPLVVQEFIFEQAPFKSCHASTIAETPDGLVVAFFGGTHEKHQDVEIWLSRKVNDTWSKPYTVADGVFEGQRYPCWNPVLYQIPDGDLLLFYKVGPDPSSWWGMKKQSENSGQSWSDPEKLPDGILGPIKNKPELLSNGDLLCFSSTEHDGWKVHVEITKDFGETWIPKVQVDPESNYQVIQPTLLHLKNGWIQMLCRSKDGFIITSLSQDQGRSWSVLESTVLPNPNSGIDAVTLSNGKHILVYNHSRKPENKWGGPRYPLNLAISEDGDTWNASIELENKSGEYSYPSIIEDKKGLIHIVYTWNRTKIKHVVLNPEYMPEASINIWNEDR